MEDFLQKISSSLRRGSYRVFAASKLDVLRVSFFFSSRRRHTRCSRDWSSDVCSSDLLEEIEALRREGVQMRDELAKIQEERQYLLHQLEGESQEHSQALEQLAPLQGERQSLLEQLEEMSRTRLQMEERIKRLEERLLQDHRQKLL